ncbi:MAG: hypothetical protein FJX84_03115 [Bacteroidetes bacterium]|nr:hypothetical protein [Bacteroidota bacterium]
MKLPALIFIQFVSLSLISQITFTKKPIKDSLYRNHIYAFINRTNTFRMLVPNEDFIPGNLGERVNEKSLNTYSFGIGLKGYVVKNLIWDGGMTYIQNGEQYNFESATNDSTFAYQTYYKYIAMPLKLNFTFGKSVRIFGGAGILPKLFLNYKQKQQWETVLGSRESNVIQTKDGFNTFVTSAIFNLGISLHSKNGYGIFINPEYRLQLQNSLGKTSYFKHKSSGLGISLGILKEL